MSTVTIQYKIEQALIAYLQTFQGGGGPIDGLTFYPGHGSQDLLKYPRCIITFAQAGGGLAYDGNYECPGEALLLWEPKNNDTTGNIMHQALLCLLNQEQLAAVQAVTNAPTVGPDLRAVKQFGLDSIALGDQLEGRDEKDNKHGVKIPLLVWAHNEAT
jgi:hypothetical protein